MLCDKDKDRKLQPVQPAHSYQLASWPFLPVHRRPPASHASPRVGPSDSRPNCSNEHQILHPARPSTVAHPIGKVSRDHETSTRRHPNPSYILSSPSSRSQATPHTTMFAPRDNLHAIIDSSRARALTLTLVTQCRGNGGELPHHTATSRPHSAPIHSAR